MTDQGRLRKAVKRLDVISLEQRVERVDAWLREGGHAAVADLMRDVLDEMHAQTECALQSQALYQKAIDSADAAGINTSSTTIYKCVKCEELLARLAAVRQLLAAWTERARGQGAIYASGIDECADELASVLGEGQHHGD